MYVIGSTRHADEWTRSSSSEEEQNKRREGKKGVPLQYSGIGKKRNVKIIPVLYIYSHTNNLPIKECKINLKNVKFTPIDI